jgi:hypothetical protein
MNMNINKKTNTNTHTDRARDIGGSRVREKDRVRDISVPMLMHHQAKFEITSAAYFIMASL